MNFKYFKLPKFNLLLCLLFLNANASTFNEWQTEAIQNYKQNKTKLKTSNLTVDPRFLTYSHEGIEYPAIIYNNEVVPAIIINGNKKPACIIGKIIFKAILKNHKLLCELKYHKNNVALIKRLQILKHPEAININNNQSNQSSTTKPKSQKKLTPYQEALQALAKGELTETQAKLIAKKTTKPKTNKATKPKSNKTTKPKINKKLTPYQEALQALAKGELTETQAKLIAKKNKTPKLKPQFQNALNGNSFVNFGTSTRTIGIKRGSYIKGRLNHSITSSDQTKIEFYTLETIIGSRGTIPSLSIVYCSSSLNLSAEKVEFFCNELITPNNTKYPVNITIHQLNKIAGLTGKLDFKLNNIAKSNIKSNTLNTLTKNTPNNLVGDILDESAKQINKFNIKQDPIITIYPQKILMRFNE